MQKIIYGIHTTEIGDIILGQTEHGICWLGFMRSKKEGAFKGDGFTRMKQHFPKAVFEEDQAQTQKMLQNVLKAWKEDRFDTVHLDLQGSDFHQSVWQALCTIPKGQTKSYGQIANDLDKPKASRAVGGAVGNNPVSLIVPCHRVVQANGALGHYGWGIDLKEKLLKSEGAL